MADPMLREMGPGDVAEALEVFASVAEEGLWLGTQPGFDRQARAQSWTEGLDDPARRTLLVVDPDTGRILGNGSVHMARYGVAEVGMALAAPARGRGLGGVLLDALVEIARDFGAHKVDLQVWPHNAAALGLYLSRGFVVEGRLRAHYRRADGRVWDAIVMGLFLDRSLTDGSHGAGLPDAPGLPPSIAIGGPQRSPDH